MFWGRLVCVTSAPWSSKPGEWSWRGSLLHRDRLRVALFLLVVLVVAISGVLVEEAGHLSGPSPRGFKEVSTRCRSLVLFSSSSLLFQRHAFP